MLIAKTINTHRNNKKHAKYLLSSRLVCWHFVDAVHS